MPHHLGYLNKGTLFSRTTHILACEDECHRDGWVGDENNLSRGQGCRVLGLKASGLRLQFGAFGGGLGIASADFWCVGLGLWVWGCRVSHFGARMLAKSLISSLSVEHMLYGLGFRV